MFHKMKSKRSFVAAFATISSLLLLLTAYQNCGGSLTSLNSGSSTSSSLCSEEECVTNGGDETPPLEEPPPDGKEGEGNGPDPIDPSPSPILCEGCDGIEEPLPEPIIPPPNPTIPPPQTSFENQWIQVVKRTKAQKTAGLSGGEGWQMIAGITYAPSNPSIVYMGIDTNQVWKSTDGGTSWKRKGGGYPANGANSLVVDPNNENIVYAAGYVGGWWADMTGAVVGIMRTADGGDTWTLVKKAQFHHNYGKSGVNFAFAGNAIYAAPSTGGILKSTNGTDWNLLNKTGGGYILETKNKHSITAHPTDRTILFVSTTDGLYKIVDSGVSATETKLGTLPAGSAYQVVIDHDVPNTMYVAMGTNGVWKSTNGGTSFSQNMTSPVNHNKTPPIGGSARFITMSPVNANKLIVTFRGLFGKYVYHTSNGGASWIQTTNMDEENADGWVAGSVFGWTTNLSGVDNSSAPIVFHPTNQDIALVAGWGNQVKKTTDGGVTWKYSNTGYTGASSGKRSGPSAIGWDPNNSNRASFSHTDFGTLLTTNNEDTFTNITAGASYNGSKAARSIDMHGNIIVETVGQGAGVSVFISRNSGASWIDSGATHTKDMEFISFHPQKSNIVYAGKYRFDNIGTSETYETLTKPINGIYRGNGDVVYSHNGNSTIYKSVNKGATWTTPYPSLNLPSGHHIYQIAIDPTNENRIYAVGSKGLYIINDTAVNGGTAVLKNEAHGIAKDQFGKHNLVGLAIDPNNANIVYVSGYEGHIGMSNGVFRSTDKGLTWTNINGNLGSYINTHNLIVNPHTSYVYLNGPTGTWKLPPPPSASTSER